MRAFLFRRIFIVVGVLIKFGSVIGCSLFMLILYSYGADRRYRFQQSLLVNISCISFQLLQQICCVRERDAADLVYKDLSASQTV